MNSSNLIKEYKSGNRDFRERHLGGFNLGWANLDQADFRNTDFYGANLSGASLKQADLSEKTNLAFSDLSRADLTEADLKGANLEGANLEGTILEKTLYDEHTVFPKGFDPSNSGAIQFSQTYATQKENFHISRVEEKKNQEKVNNKPTDSQVKIDKDLIKEVKVEDKTPVIVPLPELSPNPKVGANVKLIFVGVAFGSLISLLGALAIQSNNKVPVNIVNDPSFSVPEPTITQAPSLNKDLETSTNEIQKKESSFPAKLTNSEIREVISGWFTAKARIFAPPYDRELLSQVTSGKLYQDTVAPGQGIDWLIENNAYYQFGEQGISYLQNINVISSDEIQADALVNEERILYINGKVDSRWSGRDKSLTRYTLVKENGTWKISDYEDLK